MRKKLLYPGQLIQIILLGIWVLFQYMQENKLYAIFIVFFFVILSVFRLKNFTFIALSVLVIVLFKTPVLNTWVEIKKSNLNTFQSFKPSISKLFTPNSGKETLPTNVQQMLILIQENKIVEYRLCSTFAQDPLTNQRIVESAWPIKKTSKSKHLLCPMEEIKNIEGCNEIDKQTDVILAYCP